MRFGLLLLAAGYGRRLGKRVPKALVDLRDKPLFLYPLLKFQKSKLFNQIILVIPEGYKKKFRSYLAEYKIERVVDIITGGKKRVDSVDKGIKAIKNCDYIFIHDSARPFIRESLLIKLYKEVRRYPAVIPGIPVSSTLKYCEGGFTQKTLRREGVYEIQTPQAFDFKLLSLAIRNYKKKKIDSEIYDDSYLVEMIDAKVKVISGDIFNIKITYPRDLKLAEVIAKLWR